MKSIEQLVDREYGNNRNTSLRTEAPNEKSINGNGRGKKKKRIRLKRIKFLGQEENNPKAKRSFAAYKYSFNLRGLLHEAVLLAGGPVFLRYEDGEITSVEEIEESSRIIRPPDPEEYPYEPYEFNYMDEVISYVNQAKLQTIDYLYQKAKSIVEEYNDQDKHKQILIAADIILSYFQDRFSTTHYVGIIGDNGSGKSTIGDTFEAVGYRTVNMTDPTAANIFRVLGTKEPGQCTIIADEAEKIDQSSDMTGILKTGYHIKKKIAKTNPNTWKQEFFWTYCFKMIISERSPNQSNAKGVLDRMFIINTYRGNPKYDIKEILNPQGNPLRQSLLEELIDFRKLMLIYRLIHFKDLITDIDVGLDGRDKELCKPLIQLFSNTSAQKEIEGALEKFIDSKKQRKENTIEAVLHPIIINQVSQHGNEIYASRIWDSIIQAVEGVYDGDKKPNEYQTLDHGTIYRNTITNIICDKFGAVRRRKNDGTVLIFDPEKLVRAGRLYNLKSSIQTKISNLNDSKIQSEGSESSEGSAVTLENSNESKYRENEENSVDVPNDIQNITSNSVNLLQDNNTKDSSISPELSQPSQPSLIIPTMTKNIYRIRNSDIWACGNCKQRDDIHSMKEHRCNGQTRR